MEKQLHPLAIANTFENLFVQLYQHYVYYEVYGKNMSVSS